MLKHFLHNKNFLILFLQRSAGARPILSAAQVGGPREPVVELVVEMVISSTKDDCWLPPKIFRNSNSKVCYIKKIRQIVRKISNFMRYVVLSSSFRQWR